MSDSLLTTLAILLANYGEDRDFLSNFEPFVIDCLKEWPPDREIRPRELRGRLSSAHHLPQIPLNTVTALRERAVEHGYVTKTRDRKYLVNREAVAAVPSLAANKNEFIASFNKLRDTVSNYAREVHRLDWSDEDAEAALEHFVEEFSVELATAKQAGDVGKQPAVGPREALSVLHGFARRAVARDPESLDRLEQIVQASMLTNVMYFQNLGNWRPRIDDLIVYLDTTLALRILGLTDAEVSDAALELLSLLKELDVPVRVFEHTLDEMQGVLDGTQDMLRRIRRKRTLDLDSFARQRMEVLTHVLQQGLEPADLEEAAANMTRRLLRLGISVVPEPEYDGRRRITLDERRFDQVLQEVGFRRENQREHDIRCVVAIHFLRDGRPARDLSRARAVFATTNERLVRGSTRFFNREGHRSVIPHCIGDVSLTTQLWLRTPEERPPVARKILIAESFAALQPGPELWARYLDRIRRERGRDEITDEEVKVLVLSAEAKEGLAEVTHGDPDEVDEQTVTEVLARYGHHVRAPVEERAEQLQRDVDTLTWTRENLEARLSRADERTVRDQATLARQARTLAEHERKRLKRVRRWRRLREGTGIFVAILLCAGAAALWATVVMDGAALAAVSFAVTVTAAAAIAWGYRKDYKWVIGLVIGIGAFLALFFNLLDLAPKDHPRARDPSTTQKTTPKQPRSTREERTS